MKTNLLFIQDRERRLEIAFVVSHLSHGSPGSFVRVQEIARHLNNFGIKATILTPFSEDLKNVSDVPMELIPSTMSSLGLMSISYKATRHVAANRYMTGFVFSKNAIRRMAKTIENGLAEVLSKRNFDVIHAVQPIAALASQVPTKKLGIPLVVDLHNIMPEEMAAQQLCVRNDRIFSDLRDMEQTIIQSSDSVTVVSEELKNYLCSHYSITGESITVVPPGGPVIPEAASGSREKNVVYAGMVNFREHVDLFAKCISHVKDDASFYISNYGDSIKVVKSITKSARTRVTYTWFKTRKQVIDFLLRAKVGILTSNEDITRQLGPPLKLYDYMACGLPIVANDIGGWTKIIKENKIGLLSADDPIDFARNIDYLLSDEEIWEEMHNNALELIASKYNWARIVGDNLVNLYQELSLD